MLRRGTARSWAVKSVDEVVNVNMGSSARPVSVRLAVRCVRLPGGGTILVAHNIDIAPRVPAAVGDRISFRGEYEWNERGGVVHWTHHDPDSGARRGWIRHRGRDYE